MKNSAGKFVAAVMVVLIGGLLALIWTWVVEWQRLSEVERMMDSPLPSMTNSAGRTAGDAGNVEPGRVPAVPVATAPEKPPETRATASVTAAKRAQEVPKARNETVDAIKGEYVASFFNKSDRDKFAALAKERGVEVVKVIDFGNSVLVRVKTPDAWDSLVKEGPVPVNQAPNLYVRAPEPLGSNVIAEVNYKPFGTRALDAVGVLPMNSGWGKGVLVAILDTGIQPHAGMPEESISRMTLEGNGNMLADDYSGHGTAVASLITGDTGVFGGMAPGASILNIKVLSPEGIGDAVTLARGIVEAVDRGAKIINLSLGSHGDNYLLKQAVAYAIGKGVALVAAVGNDGAEGVNFPARYDGVLAVAGVDAANRHLQFSNTGPQAAISAPGFGVTAVWTNDTLVGFSGTSVAVPFVSGALAMLLARNPQMQPREAIDLICRYSDDIDEPGRDKETGYGVLNVKRVIDSNLKGVRDVAVGMPFIRIPKAETNSMKIVAYIQNRGTERIDGVNMKVDINDESYPVHFSNVEVCQTVSREFTFGYDKFMLAGALVITCTAEIDGAADSNPSNNSIKTRLTRQ
ncbi:MAG: hypothetical protein C0404_10920 [Verrucomicrobia bacterium]|nr:hypothetical protein [Verrucomicrobiota bacterium]